jgi:hypothetical protein
MSFRKYRYKFINSSDISSEESNYNNIKDSRNCQDIKKDYIKKCDKTIIITNIDVFFDNGFVTKYNDKIENIIEYKEIKELMTELLNFKKILKIHKTTDLNNELEIECDVNDCIKNRIIYKYKCITKENRNKGHDIEILKQIYHKKKLNELKILLLKINKKYIELMKERNEKRRTEDIKRREEDIKRREEDAVDLFIKKLENEIEEKLTSEESNEIWQTVIKNKKTSRKRHH